MVYIAWPVDDNQTRFYSCCCHSSTEYSGTLRHENTMTSSRIPGNTLSVAAIDQHVSALSHFPVTTDLTLFTRSRLCALLSPRA